MTAKLYTTLFNHMEGTHVTQVRVESIDLVFEAWLAAVATEKTDLLRRVEPMSILAYFDSLTESRRSFERQIREAIDRGERLTALREVNVWCACFLITLLDVEHRDACPALTVGLSDPETFVELGLSDCPACAAGASHMCELWVVETSGS